MPLINGQGTPEEIYDTMAALENHATTGLKAVNAAFTAHAHIPVTAPSGPFSFRFPIRTYPPGSTVKGSENSESQMYLISEIDIALSPGSSNNNDRALSILANRYTLPLYRLYWRNQTVSQTVGGIFNDRWRPPVYMDVVIGGTKFFVVVFGLTVHQRINVVSAS